jgi:hypothetical protein
VLQSRIIYRGEFIVVCGSLRPVKSSFPESIRACKTTRGGSRRNTLSQALIEVVLQVVVVNVGRGFRVNLF